MNISVTGARETTVSLKGSLITGSCCKLAIKLCCRLVARGYFH